MPREDKPELDEQLPSDRARQSQQEQESFRRVHEERERLRLEAARAAQRRLDKKGTG
jgi:hypothetical protein